MSPLREECGIFGVYKWGELDIRESLYFGIFSLQHRGQEAAGYALYDGVNLHNEKRLGLVEDVFKKSKLKKLDGFVGIAHTRYSTQGRKADVRNAQPMVKKDVAIAHNGNLTNAEELRIVLEERGAKFETDSDTEVLLALYTILEDKSPEERIRYIMENAKGAYSLLILDRDTLIALRDPFGFRPLVVGKNRGGILLSSETASFDLLGADYLFEVLPGEMVIIKEGEVRRVDIKNEWGRRQCVFELIYFGRPDSIIFDESSYLFRKKTGEKLAHKEKKRIDIAVPVPDSGLPAALGYSFSLGVPLEFGLIRSHYIGRSFIEPQESNRAHKVKMKLLPIREILEGKSVALIDDSIVRGTTSKAIVKLLRDFGAREVHVRVASPPLIGPCFFGIDIPTREELLASQREIEGVREFLGADSVTYLTIEELLSCLKKPSDFCTSCFSLRYPEEALPKEKLKVSL